MQDATPTSVNGTHHLVSSTWQPLPRIFRTFAARDRRAVLLETAKECGPGDTSLLFLDPVEELVAWTREDLDKVLSQIDRHTVEGKFVAGFFHYECGEHFVGLPSKKPAGEHQDEPLAWLGVFSMAVEFQHHGGVIRGHLPVDQVAVEIANQSPIITADGLEISKEEYGGKLSRIREYLNAGHTYQVNFTDRIRGDVNAEPLAIYETLLQQQPVPFAAYLNRPSGAILSFSPELFYRVSKGAITVRPMKGTWPRGLNTAGDSDAARQLQHDEKNRSEHVMIVDLLRNDLGRLCEYGTVRVDDLFHVERYRTLLQMTSSISGVLRAALKPSEIFRTLFPSGSITGAPKRRTMEIITELERSPRGIYTGAIGYFGPHGEACFNVAIRTLRLQCRKLTLGVGGGIVADSQVEEEYEECRIKGAFLTRRRPSFFLIETMRCENGILLVASHLERLADSADYFGIRYDRSRLIAELQEAAACCGSVVSRIRLLLNQDGDWTISATPLESRTWNGRIRLAAERTQSKDMYLHHKTTNRSFYDQHLAAARQDGFDEVLFLNESSQLTEGAISNFFFLIDGRWLTPMLHCGVLPGIERALLLKNLNGAEECELSREDLIRTDQIFACNALQGARFVHSIETADGVSVWKGSADRWQKPISLLAGAKQTAVAGSTVDRLKMK
jgi:para-aminobenzoate synthetase / 4-amino-4-deoxychorismate lyase